MTDINHTIIRGVVIEIFSDCNQSIGFILESYLYTKCHCIIKVLVNKELAKTSFKLLRLGNVARVIGPLVTIANETMILCDSIELE